MNLLDSLLQNPAVVTQVARALDIDEHQARRGVGALAPAITRGLRRNSQQASGLDALLAALGSGGHDRYVEDPSMLGREETIRDGNDILGHVFGSKDVSRNVAGHAAEQTGLGSDVLKKMLPLVAAAAMGALSRQANASGVGQPQAAPSQMGSMLESFLDADQDGSIADDLLNLARRFF